MRRDFSAIHLKSIIILIISFVAFVVITSVLIVGVGNNKYINIQKDKNKSTVIKSGDNKSNVAKSGDNKSGIKYDSMPKVTKIRVFMTKENTIRELNLEDYVTGVVASEMPIEFEIEAIKAQAVAARTYALAHVALLGGGGCKNGKGANVCDTVHCQVYMTKDERVKVWGRVKGEEYWNKIKNAVEATAGEVLTYNDNLVMEPYYFSTSSGETENSEDVFSTNVPYLRSVASPGEEKLKNSKSSKTFNYKELSQIINNNYDSAKVSSSNIRNQITIIDRTQAGSVKNIKVGNITMKGSKFRTMLALKSANFKIKFNSSSVEVDCSGYGHDVGMSQYGAEVMAKNGKKYVDILTHYYQGTSVSK
ncbi:stage II sporulation protein D [Clostridium estertheticum]|uniref:stage II sporulation protein D n=1 Tax=Clostridium estertheticum TaxID=238834 RepID=UPI001C7DC6A9|nr:stage II sporulation protein D [Clostridium estertheticum]MBX4260729.1 stage II sporulation protein D [Clostridium estertheticum]WLC70402.1 stage II sporulation protein D [Clostridium estertheticum]